MESSLPDVTWLQMIDEAGRALGREIEMAKDAQARLFPRRLPVLETLSYSAVCIQAQEVGGDCYDFFPIGPRGMGFMVGDVAGQGLGAALLMANLQGVLRGRSRLGLNNIADLLTLANQLCFENWPEERYATLFVGEYRDEASRLRYVNCGHPPAILLHPDGSVDQLEPTAGVVGLFEDWECSTAEIEFLPGDTLLVYSDGLMEALNAEGEEFGRARAVDLLRASEHLPVSLLLKSMVDRVESFMQEQQDDITMLAVRCGSWQ